MRTMPAHRRSQTLLCLRYKLETLNLEGEFCMMEGLMCKYLAWGSVVGVLASTRVAGRRRCMYWICGQLLAILVDVWG